MGVLAFSDEKQGLIMNEVAYVSKGSRRALSKVFGGGKASRMTPEIAQNIEILGAVVSCSKDARDSARIISQYRLILVDSKELVRLMIEHKVGVTASRTVAILEIDENFFRKCKNLK